MKILNGPGELPDGEARLNASDWLREWQEGVASVPESGRLYDEEATRASSAGPFVLPPARGSTEGTEVGQRLAVLESQILRDLEGGDQRGVKRTTSGVKGLTLPAVPTPLLPEPGEEVVQQSRETVTPTPQDRKSLLRVRLEGVRAAFNATKPRRLHHGGRKDVLRTMAIRAMTFVEEGEERERKRNRKGTHTRRQQERKKKSLSSGSSVATNESDTSSSETAMGMGSRSKIMRAVEDRPGELMMSFGDQILQYVTDETKMRAPLEERGRMIDVANLASKYYAALPAEAREKINPGQHAELRPLAEALDSMGSAVGSCRRHTSSAVSSCRSQLRGADRMAPGSFHRSAPALADHIGTRGDACRDPEAGRSQSQWNSTSAPLRDSKGEACASPQAALEERLHSARFARCQKSSPRG